ncbi:hypothetical protein PPERSA_13092 [Pseudocohnilembus persalinus]|uniref:Transmembrane protein n=1 Tax=Pseudocohnilembus persalinus TaxID=266149 RepID=A0A0V0QXK2_PSEPJ|nr:hypothetical protein PPERSA_13092 [Pseudocohnilembus persalinus]|eukprot:KRX06613.1 hypothetical protein PPERSA_13092 [Pseudocohnilembus persalinus]
MKMIDYMHLFLDHLMLSQEYYNDDKFENDGLNTQPEPSTYTPDIYQENLLFLIQNYNLVVGEYIDIIKENSSQSNQEQTQIQTSFLIFTLVSFVSFLIIFVFSLPTIGQIMIYQEKIIILICRTYEYETVLEQNRIKALIDQLKDKEEPWLYQDMVQLYNNLDLDNLENKKQTMLSTKIDNQKISYLKILALMFLFCVIGSLFFLFQIALLAILSNQINSSLDINQDTVIAQYYFNRIIVDTELYAVQTKMNEMSKEFNYIENLKSKINTDTEELELYLSMYQEKKNNMNFKSETVDEQITNLYEKNICNVIECDDDLPDDFEEGLFQIIQSYFQLFQTNEAVYNDDGASWANLIAFLDKETHTDMIFKAFKYPSKAFRQLGQLIIDDLQSQLDLFLFINQLYVGIIGGLITVLFFVLGNKLISKLQNQIRSINFLLSIVPRDKWGEEATSQMLKGIHKKTQ